MSVAKNTEMCVCVYVCGIGVSLRASQSPCKAPIERGFVKPLYIKGFTMGLHKAPAKLL